MPRSDLVGSAQNRHVAAARSLLTRKGRVAASAFLVEGPHAVTDALTSAHRVREIFITQSAGDRELELVRVATSADIPVRMVTDRVLAAIGDTVTPQGVVAVVEHRPVTLDQALAIDARLVVVLDRIADPGNAGTVIRTADAAGADAVIATVGSVDLWSGKCVRASAGSGFHLPLVGDADITAAIVEAKARQIQVLSTALDGEVDLDDLIDTGALAVPSMWVFGNEAHGISESARTAADLVVRVPVYGAAESLNLAAAAAVCLYASARSLRHGSGAGTTQG